MESYRDTHEHSLIEDRIADLLAEDLITGSYDYEIVSESDIAKVHVQISNTETGQQIAVRKIDSKEQDSTIISVIRPSAGIRPVITALHTKIFLDTDQETIYLKYFPDAPDTIGRMRDNLGISNLSMIIELAIKAQRQIPDQE